MPTPRHFGGKCGGQIIGFIARRVPAGHAACGKALFQARHLGKQVIRHGRAPGLIVGKTLVAPAVVAIVFIKHGHGMGWLHVLNQLAHGVLAGQ